MRAVSWFASLELFDRLFAFRLTAYSVQLSVSSDLPSIALMLGIIVVGLVVARATVAPTRYPYKESCMSNRDGILDSHPSERVKMPPELLAFDRWDADPNDLAKWEAAMAAFAPALAAGADNPNATVNL